MKAILRKTLLTIALLSIVTSGVTNVQLVDTASAVHNCNAVDHLVYVVTLTLHNTDKCTNNHVSHVIQDAKQNNKIEDQQTKTDLFAFAASQRTQSQANLDTKRNYLNDSETVAWSKAEAELIDSLEENESRSKAVSDAKAEIRNYYSRQQINLIETWDGAITGAEYVNEVAYSEDGLSAKKLVSLDGVDYNGSHNEVAVTLNNGTTYQGFEYVSNDSNLKGTIVNGEVINVTGGVENFEDGQQKWGCEVIGDNASENPIAGSYSCYRPDNSDPNIDFSDGVTNTSMLLRFPVPMSNGIWNWVAPDDSAIAFFETAEYANGTSSGSHVAFTDTDDFKVQSDKVYKFTWVWDFSSNTYKVYIYDHSTGNKIDNTTTIDFFQGVNAVDAISFGQGTDLTMDNLYEGGSYGQNVKTIEVSDSGKKEVIVHLQDYKDLYDDMNSTANRLVNNFDPYANELYNETESGNISTSEAISPSTLMQEYSQKLNDTGYWSNAFASMALAGMDTPDLGNTSHMVISYDSRINDSDDGRYKGLLFSREPPTYSDPSFTDGKWYTGYEYNSSNITGVQTFITQEGDYITLNGTWTIEEMKDIEGNKITSTTTREYNYKTTNTTDYQNKIENYSKLRNDLEDREVKLTGSLAGEDTSTGLFSSIDSFFNGIQNWLNDSLFAGIPNWSILVVGGLALVLLLFRG